MPAIHIKKSASTPQAYIGDTVTYTMAVTNVGVGALEDVVVTDPKCNSAPAFQGGDTDGDSKLDETETWTYTCPHVVTAADADPLVNVATATGEDKNGNEVSDDDDATVDILHQAIDIEKTGPATATVGDALNYTLTVTNPGDTAFPAQQVIVTDPKCEAPPAGPNTGSDATPATLDPGDAWTYTCTAQTAGQQAGTTFVNTANVAGKDVNGRDATDTDDFPTLLQAQVVLPEPTIVNGTARLRGPSGCVRRSVQRRRSAVGGSRA